MKPHYIIYRSQPTVDTKFWNNKIIFTLYCLLQESLFLFMQFDLLKLLKKTELSNENNWTRIFIQQKAIVSYYSNLDVNK